MGMDKDGQCKTGAANVEANPHGQQCRWDDEEALPQGGWKVEAQGQPEGRWPNQRGKDE